MIPLSLAEVAELTGGTLAGDPHVLVTGAAFVDSRAPEPGGLFVAVVGEHSDGHAYAEAAVAGGAAAVLGSRPTAVPTVVVDDPVVALGRLAHAVLERLPDTTVLALTGSQGKTGTKDYLAQVLAAAGPTVATRGNNNNELGVPLTALRATPDTRFLVLEMGARGVGHVGYLCEVAPPRVGAVLNIGTAHIGEFGNREAIAQAKGELVEALPAEGVAVLNADDDLTVAMRPRTRARVLLFGVEADVRWRDVALDDLGRPEFDLGHDGRWSRVRLSQLGAHQVLNATAAAAMALAVGVDLDDVASALSGATAASPWRMQPLQREDGLLVVNDAYNANPASMTAAVEALAAIGERSGRRTVAVLGEMKELGDQARVGHLSVGAAVAGSGVELLVTVGPEADLIAEGARAVPSWGGVAITTAGRDDALLAVRNNVTADDVVLVKASRGVALEHLVDGLLAVDERDEGASGR
ncbi:MAG: UDP-N-acetylmuramoyl-tripeptide--D-alanyl-D-alanine ligase [Nocardioidaceae bacterium]